MTWRAAVASVVTGAAVAGAMLGSPAPAWGHSFLVSTTPAQGERAASVPRQLELRFSERVDLASVDVAVRADDSDPIDTAPPQLAASGVEVTIPLPEVGEAVYVVGWEAFSAVDGHGSSGEFAFSVGDASGAVPSAREAAPTSARGVVATWLFFLGLSLAAGALVVRGLSRPHDGAPGPGTSRIGLLGAMAGAALALPGTPPGWQPVLLLAAIQLFAAALVLVAVTSRWWVPLVVTLAGASAWAARSHAAAEHAVLGWLVDFVHLAVGAVWLGSLAIVAAIAWRRRGRDLAALIRRYARLALALVVVVAAAGAVAAVALVPSWDVLWHTGYGRLVLFKVGLLAGALALAGVSRWWALRRAKPRPLRWLMGSEAVVVVVAVAAAGLLANGAPPQAAVAVEELLGPPPMSAAVARDAGMAGQLNTEVVSDGARLDIVVFSPSGPVPGTTIDATLERPDGVPLDLVPRPCRPGCFTQELALRPGQTTVTVRAAAPGWTGGRFVARLAWPPGEPGKARLAALVERMRAVPQLTMSETVDSGPGSKVRTNTFHISGPEFVAAEPYAAANVDDVRYFPGSPSRLVLYLPGSQMFVELEHDAAGRLVRSRLVSRGHDIDREFSYP